jgi:tyrosinase
MSTRLTRQSFIDKAAKGVATVGVFGSTPLLELAKAAPSAVVRRNLGGLAINDPILNSYRTAITAMKALPASDPLSWEYQRAIHGTTMAGMFAGWNTCEHNSYWFWPWHRMYLYYFERIIRKMSGDATWALPFWDWSAPTQRQLPPAFRVNGSPLFVSNRAAGMNSGAASLSASDVDFASAFTNFDFTTTSGQIEGTPHGVVHVRVGGFMGSVPTAGLDPIFYLHHCNIDRLWNLWLAQGGGRTDPLSDSTWKSRKFTFVDENKKVVQLTSCDVLRASGQLGYTYEGEPAQVRPSCNRFIDRWRFILELLLRWPIDRFILTSRAQIVRVDIRKIREPLLQAIEDRLRRVCLWIEDVQALRQPGVSWQVFLGGPELKPDPAGPAFVGNLALFGTGIRADARHTKFAPAKFSFVVDDALAAALKSQPDTLELMLVPTGPSVRGRQLAGKPLAPVTVGRVSFFVQTQKRA